MFFISTNVCKNILQKTFKYIFLFKMFYFTLPHQPALIRPNYFNLVAGGQFRIRIARRVLKK